MKELIIFSLSLILCTLSLSAQETPRVYKIYTGEGNEIAWENFIQQCQKSEVILFGEVHDNEVGHWLEYELARQILDEDKSWILGAEMMEFDQQIIINEYLIGFIVQSAFEEDARLWSNYEDYKPLVELAKRENRAFIATNIPRRYARTVYYYGLDTLEAIEDKYPTKIPDLPIEIDTTLESYAFLLHGMGMHSNSTKKYLMEAQAIKDAVMAHNICESIDKNTRLIHFNGKYHSDNYEGINIYLKKYCSPTITTISMESTENCKFPETGKNIADFIIVTNKNF